MKSVHKEETATEIKSAIQKRIHGGNSNVARCRVTVARQTNKNPFQISDRCHCQVIGSSMGSLCRQRLETEKEGVLVFTLALKIKGCHSRSWQGQDRVEYFGRGVPMEILAKFNVAKIPFLNQIAKSSCFERSKRCH